LGERLTTIYLSEVNLPGDLVSVRELAEKGFPLVLALQGLLGSLQLLDVSNIVFYPTIHRVTVTKHFNLGFSLASPLALLLLIWMILMVTRGKTSALIIPLLGLLAYPFSGVDGVWAIASLASVLCGLLLIRCFGKFLWWSLVLLTGFEGLVLSHWLLFVPLGLASPFLVLANIELDLYFVAAYLSPLLILPLLFVWIFRTLLEWGFGWQFILGAKSEDRDVGSKHTILILMGLVLFAVFAAIYPYAGGVNPEGLDVGVDAPHYMKSAVLVDADVSKAFSVMGGSRPLIFLAIYGFQRVTGLDVNSAVRYFPVVLVPLLVLSAFFLGFQITGRKRIALWSAFFMLTGIQVTVGIYSYFLTNMLALSLALFSVGLLLTALNKSSYSYLAGAILLGGLLPFVHPWTMDQFLGATGVVALFVGFDLLKNRANKVTFLMLSIYIASLVGFDASKTYLFQGVGGVQASIAVTSRLVGLGEFWSSSIFSFRLLFGGALSSILFLGLALVGVYFLDQKSLSHKFWIVFMATSSLVFLIGDETIKSRLLYNIPIPFFTAMGLDLLSKIQRVSRYKTLLFLFTTVASVTYLLRSLVNLV
jgi:hypothetical protein